MDRVVIEDKDVINACVEGNEFRFGIKSNLVYIISKSEAIEIDKTMIITTEDLNE